MTKWVFWHGWGMAPNVWLDLIRHLRDVSPHQTVYKAMPLPGYANTELPDGDPLLLWVDRLMANILEPVVLCGWSMGAMLALSAAYRYPNKITKLVLFGATPCFLQRRDWQAGISLQSTNEFRDGIHADPTITLRRFITLFNHQDKQSRAIGRKLTSLEKPSIPVLDAGLDFLERADFRSFISKIQQKTLLIHGANDPLMPLDAANWLAKTLPHAHLEILTDVAHAPFLSDPRQCAQLIHAFLNNEYGQNKNQ